MKRKKSKKDAPRPFTPRPSYGVITLTPGEGIDAPRRIGMSAGGTVGFVVVNRDVVTRTLWIDPEDTCDRKHLHPKTGRCRKHSYTDELLIGPKRKVKVRAGGIGLLLQKLARPRPRLTRKDSGISSFEYTISVGDANGRKVFELDPQADVSPSI